MRNFFFVTVLPRLICSCRSLLLHRTRSQQDLNRALSVSRLNASMYSSTAVLRLSSRHNATETEESRISLTVNTVILPPVPSKPPRNSESRVRRLLQSAIANFASLVLTKWFWAVPDLCYRGRGSLALRTALSESDGGSGGPYSPSSIYEMLMFVPWRVMLFCGSEHFGELIGKDCQPPCMI